MKWWASLKTGDRIAVVGVVVAVIGVIVASLAVPGVPEWIKGVLWTDCTKPMSLAKFFRDCP
ncbi:hypothetical protein [Paraburkholderia youngii]|uniref:hypothetical protein n=1 Tax=Paraburkholderia youngii TaxID=2782701 RepID=UPI003D1B5A6D